MVNLTTIMIFCILIVLQIYIIYTLHKKIKLTEKLKNENIFCDFVYNNENSNFFPLLILLDIIFIGIFTYLFFIFAQLGEYLFIIIFSIFMIINLLNVNYYLISVSKKVNGKIIKRDGSIIIDNENKIFFYTYYLRSGVSKNIVNPKIVKIPIDIHQIRYSANYQKKQINFEIEYLGDVNKFSIFVLEDINYNNILDFFNRENVELIRN